MTSSSIGVRLCFWVSLGVLLHGCHQPPSVKPRIRLGIRPLAHYAPLMIALDAGYFADQNLDVEVVRSPGGAESLPALEQGTLDVAGSSFGSAYLNLVARGGRVRVVADKGQIARRGQGGCGLTFLVRNELLKAGPLTAERLRGLRANIDRVSMTAYFLDRTLAGYGLTIDDLTLTSIPTPSVPDAFRNGAIDLSGGAEPWRTRILDEGHAAEWMDAQDVAPDSQFLVLLFGRRLLDQEFELGRRFMVAYLRGVRRLQEGRTAHNVAVVARETRLPAELLARACWVPVRTDGRPNLASMLDFQTWAIRRGLVDTAVPSDDLVDTRFLDAALAEASR